jgi:hypothetical protein
MKRDFELRFRAECPEYRAQRLAEANDWRDMRRRYGRHAARRSWRRLLNARLLMVNQITENMFTSTTPFGGGLSKSFAEFWGGSDGN